MCLISILDLIYCPIRVARERESTMRESRCCHETRGAGQRQNLDGPDNPPIEVIPAVINVQSGNLMNFTFSIIIVVVVVTFTLGSRAVGWWKGGRELISRKWGACEWFWKSRKFMHDHERSRKVFAPPHQAGWWSANLESIQIKSGAAFSNRVFI